MSKAHRQSMMQSYGPQFSAAKMSEWMVKYHTTQSPIVTHCVQLLRQASIFRTQHKQDIIHHK